MKQLLFIASMLLLSITGFAQQPTDKIIGKWESVDGDVKLHFDIFKRDGEYAGGKLYNPSEGGTYGLKAKLKNVDELDF